MKMHPARTVLATVVALGMVSGRAAAEPAATTAPAEAPAAEPTPATQPTPRLAATPAAARAPAGAPRWREGFQLVPSIGVHSVQGDGGMGASPGLRVGVLAGLRAAELVSVSVGLAYDRANLDGPATGNAVEMGLNPLFHFPLEKLEIVAGPVVGIFLSQMSIGTVSDAWGYGWSAGVNAGAMFPVGSKVHLGGLLNFSLRNPLKQCTTTNGIDVCVKDGLGSGKVVALSFAAML